MNAKELSYCESCAETAAREIFEIRAVQNSLDHLEPRPEAIIKGFEDAADRYYDYGEMITSEFRAIFYRKLAEKISANLNEKAKVFESDVKYWGKRHKKLVKSLSYADHDQRAEGLGPDNRF